MSRPDAPVRPAVRVTVGQLRVSDDHAANREVVRRTFQTAGDARSDLLVLPEYASGFDPAGTGPRHAEPLDGPFVTLLREKAARHHVAVLAGTTLPGTGLPGTTGGSSEPGGSGGPRAVNAVVAVDATGEITGVYRKVHLYDAFGHRESDRLEPGPADAEPLMVDVAGFRLGVMTCYDLRFPESARRLVDAGAEGIVIPAAWAAGPLKAMQWRALAVARAIESTAVVVAVGQAGPGVTGRSLVVGPDGVVGLELGDEAEIRTVDLDTTAVGAVRERNPSLEHRRYRVVPASR